MLLVYLNDQFSHMVKIVVRTEAYEQGSEKLRIPTVVGPWSKISAKDRFNGEGPQGPDDSGTRPRFSQPERPLLSHGPI